MDINEVKKAARTYDEIVQQLEAKGITREQIARLAEGAAAQRELAGREHFIEISQDDSMAVVISKLDKLQETVDGIAAKLDAEGSA
jgi:hypothetical protein